MGTPTSRHFPPSRLWNFVSLLAVSDIVYFSVSLNPKHCRERKWLLTAGTSSDGMPNIRWMCAEYVRIISASSYKLETNKKPTKNSRYFRRDTSCTGWNGVAGLLENISWTKNTDSQIPCSTYRSLTIVKTFHPLSPHKVLLKIEYNHVGLSIDDYVNRVP